jgi:hypothetical protein
MFMYLIHLIILLWKRVLDTYCKKEYRLRF